MQATSKQVGGDHYRAMGMQPAEFTPLNGYDPMSHTALKYISRFHRKNGIEDVQKAIHCIEFVREHMNEGCLPTGVEPVKAAPSISDYVNSNRDMSQEQICSLLFLDEAVREYARRGATPYVLDRLDKVTQICISIRNGITPTDASPKKTKGPQKNRPGITSKKSKKTKPSNRK